MITNLYTVDRVGPGRLSTMARPRGGDWLSDEMTSLSDSGVSFLVSLLTDAEVRELDLNQEADLARKSGIRFLRLPVPDRGLPERQRFASAANLALEHLHGGGHVVAHCRMGVGRSSMLAAAVLALEGMPPAEAWRAIGKARGLAVPDTQAQQEWIESWVTSLD